MTAWPEGYGRIVLKEVGSTLDEAVRLANDQAAPFWVLAHHQTAGRGRRGRAWEMPTGNFAATLLLRPGGSPAEWALRSFVMSLALFKTLAAVTDRAEDLSLKWPNDVLLSGGKVAGILLETGAGGILTTGVGVNLAAAPAPEQVEPDALRPVSVLGETSVRVEPERFLDLLAAHYAELEAQFVTYGFAPIRSDWLTKAARLGEVITARTSAQTITGVFANVDADGHLVLRGAQGVQTVAAADVYF